MIENSEDILAAYKVMKLHLNEFTEYALNLAAINVVLLVGICKKIKLK